MAVINEGKNVLTCPGIILWDGITQPETKDDGTTAHSIKIAIPANAPEKTELEALAMRALMESEFKGQLPPGGNWPILQIDVSKLGDSAPLMMGRLAINANTRNGVPPIYDSNGNELSAMQFGRMIYAGAVVDLLVHAYSYNKKSKGVAYGLDGIRIIDATAPKLDVGGGMSRSQVAAAFGGAPATATGVPPASVPGAGGTPSFPVPASVPGATTYPSNGMPPPTGVVPNTGFVANAAGAVPPPPPPAGPVYQMTAKAGGATREQFIAGGWTDDRMIAEGYMIRTA